MLLADEKGVRVRTLAAGDSILGIADGLTVLSPPHGAPLLDLWSDNDRSLVLKMQSCGRSVLLTGDAGSVAESWMQRTWGDRLKSDVLKIGHHGSRHSTSDSFVDAVHPEEAVISVGARNTHGHPSPLVIDRLDRRGVRTYRTDRSGTVIWHLERDTCWWETMPPTFE